VKQGLEEKFIHPCAGSLSHNIQGVDATQVPINGCKDKQNVVYTYIHEIFFSLKNKEILIHTKT
jgi:hypothetical protein